MLILSSSTRRRTEVLNFEFEVSSRAIARSRCGSDARARSLRIGIASVKLKPFVVRV